MLELTVPISIGFLVFVCGILWVDRNDDLEW